MEDEGPERTARRLSASIRYERDRAARRAQVRVAKTACVICLIAELMDSGGRAPMRYPSESRGIPGVGTKSGAEKTCGGAHQCEEVPVLKSPSRSY